MQSVQLDRTAKVGCPRRLKQWHLYVKAIIVQMWAPHLPLALFAVATTSTAQKAAMVEEFVMRPLESARAGRHFYSLHVQRERAHRSVQMVAPATSLLLLAPVPLPFSAKLVS